MVEYAYCMSNPSMDNKCKCGGTGITPDDRCQSLFNTSLPEKCDVDYSIKVNDYRHAEKYIHAKIVEAGYKRYNGREWFECKPSDIKHIFDEYALLYPYDSNYVKPDKIVTVNNIKKLDVNITVNDNEGVKTYICNLCNYETTDKSNLSHHNKSKRHITNASNENIENENYKEKLKEKLIEIKELDEAKNNEINKLKQKIIKLESKLTIYKTKYITYKDLFKKNQK